MLPNTPTNPPSTLVLGTIAEIDSEPLRKTPEISQEDDVNQTASLSATTATFTPEPHPEADDNETAASTAEAVPRVETDAKAELDLLQKRREELSRRRQYLQQMQEIDEEDALLEQRIAQLEGKSHPP
ncbi:hypothetical protein ED733_006161 [Metarhizium rileyi]|uniref:Uncharacterized protein n=1 Tax=Metarhizium rileyi (strain RCEF 4871) TaxID=1649241 RepID=A0A5C6GNX9_METRR|nr:hypothetical protein ED733_006161 [Metarhizium rileyi]